MARAQSAARLLCSTKVTAVTEKGVEVVREDGRKELLECDSVVCALGFRVQYSVVDELADLVDENYIIGDCEKVGKVLDAIQTGYYSALRV